MRVMKDGVLHGIFNSLKDDILQVMRNVSQCRVNVSINDHLARITLKCMVPLEVRFCNLHGIICLRVQSL
jgi:hypothetical protein